jgi:predicted ATPase
VSERDVPTPAAGLVHALADRELLVVLDNCEHVLEAAAGLVTMLLERCRRVRFLATSRERLDVPGELVFPVPQLGLPADGSAAAVAASEAGLLFADANDPRRAGPA